MTAAAYALLLLLLIVVVGYVAQRIVTSRRQAQRAAVAKEAFRLKHQAHVQQTAQFVEMVVERPASQFARMGTNELLQVARVAHHGMPGQFMSDGSFVEGVAPRATQAVQAYEELLRRGVLQTQNALLDHYAQLLEHGVPGQDDPRSGVVDLPRAYRLYIRFYEQCVGPYERYYALEAVERLAGQVGGPGDRVQWTLTRQQLAQEIAAKSAAEAHAKRNKDPQKQQDGQVDQPGRQVMSPVPVRTVQEDIWETLPGGDFRAPAAATAPPPATFSNQNTHDSGVTKTVKASIDRLRAATTAAADRGAVVRQVRDLLNGGNVSEDKRRQATQALDAIERNDHTLMSAGDIGEVELLGLVWGRIHHPDNEGNAQVLRENLVDELASAVEHGKTVCTTGRFTRVLDTLNGVDPLVDIKPKWAIAQEMVSKAGALFKDAVSGLSEADRAAMEAPEPTPDQQQTYDPVMGDVKATIRTNFKDAYVDSGVMTGEALEVELSKWIDHIG